MPLAGPANRQGRIAADHIFGRDSRYRGTQGTAIVRVFDTAAALTGWREALVRAGRPYQKVYVHPGQHAGYYPGARAMTIKLLFEPGRGTISAPDRRRGGRGHAETSWRWPFRRG